MPRNLDANLAAHLGDEVIQPAVFASLGFSSGTLNVWSGVGPFTWGGRTFLGLGNFGAISPITEGSSVQADGITVQLLGIPLWAIAGTAPSVVQAAGAYSPVLSNFELNLDGTNGNALQGGNPLYLSCIWNPAADNSFLVSASDSQFNPITVIPTPDNGNGGASYAIAYTPISQAGNDVVYMPTTNTPFDYYTTIFGAELAGVDTFDGSTNNSGGNSGATSVTGNITAANGKLISFQSSGNYSNWHCSMASFSYNGGDGLVIAQVNIGYIGGGFTEDVPGWQFLWDTSFGGIYAMPTNSGAGYNIDVTAATQDMEVGAPATIWLGLLQNGQLIGTYQYFKGLVDQPTISVDTDTISITLALENRLADLQRGNGRRYTTADQNLYYPDDIAFTWVEILNDQALRWGS